MDILTSERIREIEVCGPDNAQLILYVNLLFRSNFHYRTLHISSTTIGHEKVRFCGRKKLYVQQLSSFRKLRPTD